VPAVAVAKKRSARKSAAKSAPESVEAQPAAEAVFFELTPGNGPAAALSVAATVPETSPLAEVDLLGEAMPVGDSTQQHGGVATLDDLDDFFRGGEVADNAANPADDIFGLSPGQLGGNRAAAGPPADLIGGMRSTPGNVGPQEAGDVYLERITAEARAAIASLPLDRGSKVQQAIASSIEYVNTRVVCLVTFFLECGA
jgi:hypothetical protein